MKKTIISLVLIFAGVVANAQLLWKVDGNGAKDASYLFGTHHVAPISILEKTHGFADAMKAVDAVYGEIDMTTLTAFTQQQAVMKYAVAPADSTLTKVMTKAQLDSLDAVLSKYSYGQMTSMQMDMFKPALVDTQLALAENMQAFPEYAIEDQLDTTILKRAKAAGKSVNGFETIEQQLALLMGGSIADQVQALMETVREDDKYAEKAHQLADAYLAGDVATLEQLILGPDNGMTEAERAKLIDDRNAEWIVQLKSILPKQSVLVAVGMGHLVGEKGLINTLRTAGYTVTPVK